MQDPTDRFRVIDLKVLEAAGRARLNRLFRRGRTPGLRTAKTTLAAVAAFLLAEWLHTSDQPVLAPLTALLVVQLTMYETVAHGRERIVSVVAGVLVAVGFAGAAGLTWWSLGAVVAISLVAGRLLRLGPHLPEVAISAMLVLAVGGTESAAFGRVLETLIGAAVGVAVNLLIAPPLYIQPTRDAIGELADRMAGYARDLAKTLRGDWTRAAADRALDQARELGAEVDRADRGLARTEQSARLNPRGHLARQALADVLDAVSAAIQAAAPGSPAEPATDEELRTRLDAIEHRSHRLGTLLFVDPGVYPAACQQHGALLAAVDRLRVEIAAAARRPSGLRDAGHRRRLATDPWEKTTTARARRPIS